MSLEDAKRFLNHPLITFGSHSLTHPKLTEIPPEQAKTEVVEAKKNLEQGVTGAQSEDVAAAAATVKQAQGAYNAALANLEKTIFAPLRCFDAFLYAMAALDFFQHILIQALHAKFNASCSQG